jgi:hypothetical protein
MAHPVQHDLRYRASSIDPLARRLIIDGLREAVEGSLAIFCTSMQHELARRRIRARDERALGIFLRRFFRRERLEKIGGWKAYDSGRRRCRRRRRT